ncbi:hypothetical protein TeGR_g9872 [Tetraparma gracilis]|uniref:Uncharacterized protein n=1 Tax=Tetraparma gracilis TaxID=2962635 RepID=A0ABQ6N1Y7_9STRA|nr:hypothetical protein TeGR_g9872 [Tetraparma gracilis]
MSSPPPAPPSPIPPPPVSLDAYQTERLARIRRNNARLLSLGLISRREHDTNVLRAAGHTVEDSPPPSPRGKKRKTGERAGEPAAPREGERRSGRVRGLAPDGSVLEVQVPRTREEVEAEREERVTATRAQRLRAANALAELGLSEGEVERRNPTAGYGHCAMRVRTMSGKALGGRVKAIERAAGRHCVVKMAIFKCCLQDKGMWELAELAAAALGRLMEAGGGEEDDDDGGEQLSAR